VSEVVKFRVVYAISYDVEAEDEMEAREKAVELMEKEFGKKFTDIVLSEFGVNVSELME